MENCEKLRGGTGSCGGSGCLRHHPVTGQLSSLLLTILGWRRPGKIGSANTKPLRRKSRGFRHVTESHEGYGEAQGIAGSSGCLRHHPVTGQLSSLLLTILGWRRPGKIGSANTKPLRRKSRGFRHVTENRVELRRGTGESRRVAGSSGGCHTRRTVVFWTIAERSTEESTENNDGV